MSSCDNTEGLSIAEKIVCLQQRDGELQDAIDTVWVLVTAMGILSLQTGFTMLEAGTVQSKNVKSVLLKNISDMVFGSIVWWLLGYGLYLGDNPFAGGDPSLFVITEAKSVEFPNFVQQFGFAVTSVTIVSGAILSRMKFELYIVYSIFFTGLVYPLAAHWAWADFGWLYQIGYVDFAGSGVVHMLGGVSGLIGAWLIGPRVGRFYDKDELDGGGVRPLPPHSTVLIMLGGFLLYVGWFSFNAGSSGGMGPADVLDARRAMINTLIGSASGGVALTSYSLFWKRSHDVPLVVNGLLCGLVAITGPSGSVETWAALVIGVTGALLYIPVAYVLLYKLGIDDPVNAFAVHGVSGAWGVLMTAFFDMNAGLLYGGDGSLLLAQLAGIVSMSALSALYTFVIFFALRKARILRVTTEDQLVGLDVSFHSGYAYPEFDIHHVRVFNARQKREQTHRESSKTKLRELSERSNRSRRESGAMSFRARSHSMRSARSGRSRANSEASDFEEDMEKARTSGAPSKKKDDPANDI